jgi:hypothetical protein
VLAEHAALAEQLVDKAVIPYSVLLRQLAVVVRVIKLPMAHPAVQAVAEVTAAARIQAVLVFQAKDMRAVMAVLVLVIAHAVAVVVALVKQAPHQVLHRVKAATVLPLLMALLTLVAVVVVHTQAPQ